MSGLTDTTHPSSADTGVGRALKFQTDVPHLVSLGGGRLSTAVTLHPVPPGQRVTLGSCSANSAAIDVPVYGVGVQPLHCYIENSGGVVTLYPVAEQTSVDGVRCVGPTRLTQGATLAIGRSNYMRFNHPDEAKLMRSVLPEALQRISVAPIAYQKPPMVTSRPYNHNNNMDVSDESSSSPSFMSKVSKFEFLAAQNALKSVSPKVFAANSVTVNAPARDVLGRVPPPNLQTFAKHLPQPAVNYNTAEAVLKNKTPDRQVVFGRKSPSPSQTSSPYVNVAITTKKQCNNNTPPPSPIRDPNNSQTMLPLENSALNNFNINQSMSTTETSSFVNHSHSNKKHKNDSWNNQTSASNAFVRPMATPSPCFNRNPSPSATQALEHRRTGSVGELTKPYRCLASAGSGSSSGSHSSIEDLTQRKNAAEQKRNQAFTERIREQEKEQAEQIRLEEILNMCAEYEKQVQWEKNNKPTPNKIITNGSLPRDKRQCTSPKEPILNYENVLPRKETNNHFNKKTNNSNSQYENVFINEMGTTTPTPRSTEQSGPYENVVFTKSNTSPRTKIKTFLPVQKPPSSPNENSESKYSEKATSPRTPTTTKQKFILPIEFGKSTPLEPKANEDGAVNKMKAEKREILAIMATLKRNVADIEIQEEELLRELELEKALLNGENQVKQVEMAADEQLKEKLIFRAKQIELKMDECRMMQSQHQDDCRNKLENALQTVVKLESELLKMSKTSSTYKDLVDELALAREQLDNEKKSFEDLEFHHLEEEADWLASREEIQRELHDLLQRIEARQMQMRELDTQKTATFDHITNESRLLEKQLNVHMRKLDECRYRLTLIEAKLAGKVDEELVESDCSTDSENEKKLMTHSLPRQLQRNHEAYNMSQSFNEKMLRDKTHIFDDLINDEETPLAATKCPSQDDIDRISRVTSSAPISIVVEDGLGRKTIESLKELERSRQRHLAQQGCQVIEQERRRMSALKQRAQDEGRIQWEATHIQSAPPDSVCGSEELEKNSKFIENDNEQHQDVLKMLSESESPDSARPLSESSELSCDTGISGTSSPPPSCVQVQVARRPHLTGSQRPLTRYLPIRNSELDLRKHIESAGHPVELCTHVTLTSTTCKGYLHKMGTKLHGWHRRWFVFDRCRRTFAYYSEHDRDRDAKRSPRGGVYFQAIEDVYVDHQNAVKSPNPHVTFVLKTHERHYYLMAATPEAMRIWMDVIFTGAEGYQEFEHGT